MYNPSFKTISMVFVTKMMNELGYPVSQWKLNEISLYYTGWGDISSFF